MGGTTAHVVGSVIAAMNTKEGLLGGALSRVARNKRYIFWFYLLNAALAVLGAGAFENQAHELLDHSLRAERLVHGFDLAVFIEMLARPEFGPTMAAIGPAIHFALLYFALTVIFMPGVLQGYAANYRLPRGEFFRVCGNNLWRFIRVMIVAGIVMGAAAAALFGLRAALVKQAGESTNELLPFYIRLAGLCVIFLVMTTLRIWLDLAEVDIVLSDQGIVKKSLRKGFTHVRQSLGRLLGAYVVVAIIGIGILVAGISLWINFVPAPSVLGAIVVGQVTALLLLIPRFWQRGVAVTCYLQNMVEPVAARSFANAEAVSAAGSAESEPGLQGRAEPAAS